MKLFVLLRSRRFRAANLPALSEVGKGCTRLLYEMNHRKLKNTAKPEIQILESRTLKFIILDFELHVRRMSLEQLDAPIAELGASNASFSAENTKNGYPFSGLKRWQERH